MIHYEDECQKYWREVFSDQIQQAVDAKWPEETDTDIERARWFREGLKYAMMIVRWEVID